MADLSITASNVVPDAAANIETVTAGEEIQAGEPIYQDASTQKYLLADASTIAEAAAFGIACNHAYLDQPVTAIRSGGLAMGSILTTGTVYCVSATEGGIAPVADLSSGESVTILGAATTTSKLSVRINRTGVTI